jgi:hypothetical protein
MSCIPQAAPFSHLEREFVALTTGTHPLTVDGLDIGHGLPDRPIPLNELRDLLLDRAATRDLKQAAWATLVHRAQTGGPEWTVAATGMMLPGLRRIVSRIHKSCDRGSYDLQNEVVLGFLETLRSMDPRGRALPSTLWWAAYKRGLAAFRAEIDAAGVALVDGDVRRVNRLQPPAGHPDLILAQAIRDNILNSDDADLIGSTRIEKEPLHQAARRRGLSYTTCRLRRWRAEKNLTRYLGHGCLVGHHPDNEPIPTAA